MASSDSRWARLTALAMTLALVPPAGAQRREDVRIDLNANGGITSRTGIGPQVLGSNANTSGPGPLGISPTTPIPGPLPGSVPGPPVAPRGASMAPAGTSPGAAGGTVEPTAEPSGTSPGVPRATIPASSAGAPF